jgi:hypothetical protein
MPKPFLLKLIIAATFLHPLGVYVLNPHANPLGLIALTAICVAIAIGLHNLNNKIRIAYLVLLYAGAAVGALVLLAPLPTAKIISATIVVPNLAMAWYLHRSPIRALFNPSSYDPYENWNHRKR